MRHQWVNVRYGAPEYDAAIPVVAEDPLITYYPDGPQDEPPFGLVIDDNGNETSVDIYSRCRNCGAIMVSDHGGDYLQVVGAGTFYECP